MTERNEIRERWLGMPSSFCMLYKTLEYRKFLFTYVLDSTTYLACLAGDFVLCVFPFVVRKVGRIQPREGWTDVNETISHPLPPLRYPRYLARFGLTQSSWVTLLLNHFDKQKTHQKWQASDLFNLHSKGRQQIVVARNIIIHTDNRQ